MKGSWPIVLAVVVVVVAFPVVWFLSTTLSATVRYAGLTLQLFGLVVLAEGLRRMRRLFRQPSLKARVVGWFGRLAAAIGASRPTTIQVATADSISVRAAEGPRVIQSAGPGASPEQRILILEENVNRLRDELDAKVQGLQRDLAAGVERESQERQGEYQETRRMIEDVAIGGLRLEALGLVSLILGVIGTSIPEEVASAIYWLCAVLR